MTPVCRTRLSQKVAASLAHSFVLARGRRLFEANCRQWHLPLTKWDKLWAGLYIICKDYGAGNFPPRFDDQTAAHAAERDYLGHLPGISKAEEEAGLSRRPFLSPELFSTVARHYARIWSILRRLGLEPGARLIELGCGVGWLSEFLALSGFHMVGTSIGPREIELAGKRAESFQRRGLPTRLEFAVAAMEEVDVALAGRQFDGALVFEALHHAFDWRKSFGAARRLLAPGGWFLIAHEPNVLHTFVSYRVARISNTHEIGLSRREMRRELRRAGFGEVRLFGPRWNNGISCHWLAARAA